MVPENMIERWEAAYRRYGNASRASVNGGDQSAAREMAEASREVAEAWREMERVSGLSWWVAAALVAAAQAFEAQARDWSARAEFAWPLDVSRQTVRLSTRARPRSDRRGGQ
jgi:hypothetical protein